jgi:hypothetical protein
MAINFPNSPTNGQLYTTSTSGFNVTYVYNSAATAWRASTTSTGYANLAINEIVATAGQTTFAVPGGYIVGQLQVFANGVQLSAANYTANDSVNVVVNKARLAGDVMRFTSTNSLWGVTNANAFIVNEVVATNNNQTAFTINYNSGTTMVLLNGVTLNGADYVATNGTSITLASGFGVQAGHILKVISFNNVNLSGALSLSGGTINGTLNVNGKLNLNNLSIAGLSAALAVALGA